MRGGITMKLKGCSNPGFSLTEVRKNQILDLYEWIEDNIEYEKTYKEMQEDVECSCENLDASKVRMLVPLLRKMGYINDYEQRNSKLKIKNFFTKEGKIFIEYLKLGQIISMLNKDEISNEMKKIDILFSRISLLNLITSGEKIYLDVIEFLEKYTRMDKNEFFIMTTLQSEYEGEKYIKMLDRYVKQYRNDEMTEIEIVKHQNSFNYVKSLLMEAGLVVQNKNIISLNAEYYKLFNIL